MSTNPLVLELVSYLTSIEEKQGRHIVLLARYHHQYALAYTESISLPWRIFYVWFSLELR
jgi:hypothetical protein